MNFKFLEFSGSFQRRDITEDRTIKREEGEEAEKKNGQQSKKNGQQSTWKIELANPREFDHQLAWNKCHIPELNFTPKNWYFARQHRSLHYAETYRFRFLFSYVFTYVILGLAVFVLRTPHRAGQKRRKDERGGRLR